MTSPSPLVLNNIPFRRVFNASGARSFFGEGYWWHGIVPGLDWQDTTFVAKTTTVEPRAGNLPLNGRFQPREVRPRCIAVHWRKGAVLNAVGLSGPGLAALLADGRWQARIDPFFLSFMAVEADLGMRIGKAERFAGQLASERHRFRAPFGVEVNLSCPNVGVHPRTLVNEAGHVLDTMASELSGVPLVPKFNALVPVEDAAWVADHPACAAVCVSNTIPWGKLPERIDWRGLFGEVSPLAQYGGGGLSGAPLLPLVRDWVAEAVRSGFPVPIIAGGGILCPSDAVYLLQAGAAAVELGSVAILRSWRVAGIVRAVNACFVRKEKACKV
jgi:dihydroorotate dehydrogenase